MKAVVLHEYGGPEDAMAEVGLVDAVADTVGGKTAELLLSKVKPAGFWPQ